MTQPGWAGRLLAPILKQNGGQQQQPQPYGAINVIGGSVAVNPATGDVDLTIPTGVGVVPNSLLGLRSLVATASRQFQNVDVYSAPGDGGGGQFNWNATDTRADDGGTIIAVTGVATGRWNRINPAGPLCNTSHFGAVGDGIADDTAAIQRAISAASIVAVGIAVVFIHAQHVVTTLTVPSNIQLRGKRGYSTLVAKSTSVGQVVSCSGDSIDVADLIIQAAAGDTVSKGVFLSSCTKASVHDCQILGFGYAGVYAYGGASSASSGLDIHDNVIDGTGAGVTPNTNGVYALNVRGGVRIHDNEITGTGQGIAAGSVSGLIISSNWIHDITAGTAQHGMYVYSNAGATIVNNLIQRVNSSGIKYLAYNNDVSNLVVVGNSVDGGWAPWAASQVYQPNASITVGANSYRTTAGGTSAAGTALSGTVTVTAGSTALVFSASQALTPGQAINFAFQPNVTYTIASGSGTSWTLSGSYNGKSGSTTALAGAVFPTTIGQTLVDNTVTWTCISNSVLGNDSGIDVNAPSTGFHLRGATIASNTVRNMSGYGIYLGYQIVGGTVSNNTIGGIGRYGIYLNSLIGPMSDIQVVDNTIEGAALAGVGHGIGVVGAGGTFSNLRILDNLLDNVPDNNAGTWCILVQNTTGLEICRNGTFGSSNASALNLSSNSGRQVVRDNQADAYGNNSGVSTTAWDRNSWDPSAPNTIQAQIQGAVTDTLPAGSHAYALTDNVNQYNLTGDSGGTSAIPDFTGTNLHERRILIYCASKASNAKVNIPHGGNFVMAGGGGFDSTSATNGYATIEYINKAGVWVEISRNLTNG